ncbi:hypothetical protein ACIQD3_23775 [Peribacillus loiseleuriae]|uniref:hypothetical protein n=1 Tax=Peribacillus loiseleuriae TaxID=1679170 RepID=UPI003823A36D
MFIQAKKKREELRLPILHYIVADNWMDKLGHKAFTAWLKFHTWVNRQDERIEDISRAKIPMSMDKVAEKLGINKSTLYRTIIPVLWEYGLIDLIEYEDSKRKTQKPVNIIPYDYPQNNKELETKPLEKCRDWKKDYNTQATFYGRKGGRSASIKPFSDGCENATVDGCENATVDGCENATVTVAKMQPNNYSNNSINVSNNSLNHDSNTLLMDEEEKSSNETKLYRFLVARNIDSFVAKSIVELADQNEILLYDYEVKEQLRQMYFETEVEGKTITDYPYYFLNGIVMQRQQRKTKKQRRDLEKIQEEQNKIQRKLQPKKHVPLYNWLES